MNSETAQGDEEMFEYVKARFAKLKELLKNDVDARTLLADTITLHDVKRLIQVRTYVISSFLAAAIITSICWSFGIKEALQLASIFVITLIMIMQILFGADRMKMIYTGKLLGAVASRANAAANFLKILAVALSDGTITPDEAVKLMQALKRLISGSAQTK